MEVESSALSSGALNVMMGVSKDNCSRLLSVCVKPRCRGDLPFKPKLWRKMSAWRYVLFPVPFDAPPLRPPGSQVHSRPRYSAAYRPMRVQRPQRARAEPWSTGRVRAPEYRPLEVFGGTAEELEQQKRPLEEEEERYSEDVELLELSLRLREFELRRTMGENETSPDRFVRNIWWYKEPRPERHPALQK